jgi:hypothetical protein
MRQGGGQRPGMARQQQQPFKQPMNQRNQRNTNTGNGGNSGPRRNFSQNSTAVATAKVLAAGNHPKKNEIKQVGQHDVKSCPMHLSP